MVFFWEHNRQRVNVDRKHTCPECREVWMYDHACHKTGIHYQYNTRAITGFFIEPGRARPLTLKEFESTENPYK